MTMTIINHESPAELLPLIAPTCDLLRTRSRRGYSALANTLEALERDYQETGRLIALGELRRAYQVALRSLAA